MKQTDIYTEALTCLRSILLADHPEFQNWIDWLERDIQDWTQRREVAHHLRAYGGMGSFNDLPSMWKSRLHFRLSQVRVLCLRPSLWQTGRHFSGGTDGGVPARCSAGSLSPP